MNFKKLVTRYREMDLLRITTAGSVDDGKSTLIGRLLFESKAIFEDQLSDARTYSSRHRDHDIDLALITDGLKAEREQGITIDVAYRFFSTPRRRFIIADTPGHEQYTRNMVTGASTACLAVILVDILKGITPQTKRHTFISSLLGIRHIIVAVNKMDLVKFQETKFRECVEEFRHFSDKLPVESIQFIPMSALHGENVVKKSRRMKWYHGYSLLEYLEEAYVPGWRNLIDFRFPVQYVLWSGTKERGYCGSLASGTIRVGEKILVLPSGKTSSVKRILTPNGESSHAFCPQAVTLYLSDDLDISRGDIIVREKNIPSPTRSIECDLVWMDNSPLIPGKVYWMKHLTQICRCSVSGIRYRFDTDSCHRKPAETLHMNEIGKGNIRLLAPVYADPYEHNRQTGSFILIDPVSHETSAAGMITRCDPVSQDEIVTGDSIRQGTTTWFRLPSRETEARAQVSRLEKNGLPCIYLDVDQYLMRISPDSLEKNRRETMELVVHFCRIANASGVHMVVGSSQPMDHDILSPSVKKKRRASGS